MKEFIFSKRDIFLSLILGCAIAVAIILFNFLLNRNQTILQSPSSEEFAIASIASEAAETFFTIDCQLGKEAWLEDICKLSTSAGCDFFTAIADQLWDSYSKNETQVSASVQSIRPIKSNGEEQILEVEVLLSNPLPGSNRTRDFAYLLLVQTEDEWKLDRFLFEAEIKAILNSYPESEVDSTK